jgi:hypothetical protein
MGNKPLAAITPNMTALTMVPCSLAMAEKSQTCDSREQVFTKSSSGCASSLPSPMGMRSSVVKLRDDELNTLVRSADTSPSEICLAVSKSSVDTNASSSPGTGFKLNTGCLPFNSAKGVGNTSM